MERFEWSSGRGASDVGGGGASGVQGLRVQPGNHGGGLGRADCEAHPEESLPSLEDCLKKAMLTRKSSTACSDNGVHPGMRRVL